MTFPARLSELIAKAWPRPWEYKDGWLCEPDTPYRHSHFARINQENAELIAYLVNHAEAIRDLIVAVDEWQSWLDRPISHSEGKLIAAREKLEEA